MNYLRIILQLISKFANALNCNDFNCPKNWIGDNYCDFICNNPICNFDSPSISTSPANVFESSDCFKDCLQTGCSVSLLSNDICDEECNNNECSFDLGLCGICAQNCSIEMLENNKCDPSCYSYYCNDDMKWCGVVCGYSCTNFMLINYPEKCFPDCTYTDCNLFNNHCFEKCSDKCKFRNLNNSICELDCFNEGCEYDGDDCSCFPGILYFNLQY